MRATLAERTASAQRRRNVRRGRLRPGPRIRGRCAYRLAHALRSSAAHAIVASAPAPRSRCLAGCGSSCRTQPRRERRRADRRHARERTAELPRDRARTLGRVLGRVYREGVLQRTNRRRARRLIEGSGRAARGGRSRQRERRARGRRGAGRHRAHDRPARDARHAARSPTSAGPRSRRCRERSPAAGGGAIGTYSASVWSDSGLPQRGARHHRRADRAALGRAQRRRLLRAARGRRSRAKARSPATARQYQYTSFAGDRLSRRGAPLQIYLLRHARLHRALCGATTKPRSSTRSSTSPS